MSDTLQLGQLIVSQQSKDAIHIAVAPVTAASRLEPGQGIAFARGSNEIVAASSDPIGIVDPFLEQRVLKGDRFWMWLKPGSITSLRHDWTHPAFVAEHPPSETRVSEDRSWIESFAARVGLTCDDLMEGAREWVNSGAEHYLNRGGLLEGEYVPDEFWGHYEAVTGKSVPEKHRGSFFTCSC